MCFKKRPRTHNQELMIEYVRSYMIEYLAKNPDAGDDVVPIFTSVKQMLMNASEHQLTMEMIKQSLSMEETVLNIMQNHALMAMKPQRVTDWMQGASSPAHELYDALNDLKLQKHFISQKQYDDNKDLANRLSIIPPGGSWF